MKIDKTKEALDAIRNIGTSLNPNPAIDSDAAKAQKDADYAKAKKKLAAEKAADERIKQMEKEQETKRYLSSPFCRVYLITTSKIQCITLYLKRC